MAKSKYPDAKTKLLLVEKWARDGLSEKQIATNLGICKSTMEDYKKRHPDFLAALKKGKEPFLAEVENALAKRALGFEYTEEKTYIKKNDDGTTTQYKEIATKYYPPDVAACSILLKNKDKDETGKSKWSDNPGKLDLEREMAEFKKEIERIRTF